MDKERKTSLPAPSSTGWAAKIRHSIKVPGHSSSGELDGIQQLRATLTMTKPPSNPKLHLMSMDDSITPNRRSISTPPTPVSMDDLWGSGPLNINSTSKDTLKSNAIIHKFVKSLPKRLEKIVKTQMIPSEEEKPFLMPEEKVLPHKGWGGVPARVRGRYILRQTRCAFHGILVLTNYRVIFLPTLSSEPRPMRQHSGSKLFPAIQIDKNTMVSVPYRAIVAAKESSFYDDDASYEEVFDGSDDHSTAEEEEDFTFKDVSSVSKPQASTKKVRPPSGGSTIPEESEGAGGFVILNCHDVREEVLFFDSEFVAQGMAQAINQQIEAVRTVYRPALDYGKSLLANFNRQLWQPPYDIEEDMKFFNEVVGEDEKKWTTIDNYYHDLCRQYQRTQLFPSSIVPESLRQVKLNYQGDLFPLPLWIHPSRCSVLWRSGNYSGSGPPTHDQFMESITTISATPMSSEGEVDLKIFVAGEKVCFQLVKAATMPKRVQVDFLEAVTFLDLLDAYHEIHEYCARGPFRVGMLSIQAAHKLKVHDHYSSSLFSEEWYAKLQNSRWTSFCVSKTLAAASTIASTLEEGISVHIQAGTSFVISILAQLLLSSEFRTVRGFVKLMEKDWFPLADNPLAYLNVFGSYLTQQNKSVSKAAPVALLLLLDCISQLLVQHPTAFEFSHDLLLLLIDEFYYAKFDSCITFSHIERHKMKMNKDAFSLWSYLARNTSDFLNQFYTETPMPLTVEHRPDRVQFWGVYFLRNPFVPQMESIRQKLEYAPHEATSITVAGEGVPSIPKNLGRLASLTVLDLSGNRLTTLPNELGDLVHLKKLKLYKNFLVHIHSGVFKKLLDLSEIYLEQNLITSISGLELLLNLKKLRISNNRLQFLPPVAIGKLECLEVDDNPLVDANTSVLFRNLAHATALRHLDLSGLGLLDIPEQVTYSTEIVSLRARNNRLADLPDSLMQFSKIQRLNLDNNNFGCIPYAIFYLTSLKFLNLDHCEITEIPPEISTLSQLRSLSLSRNSIQHIPEDIFKLSELRSLILTQNRISILPPTISTLQKLEDLNIAENQIATLPRELAKNLALITLDVRDNSLQYLPPELGNLSFLQGMKLCGNPLKTPSREIISQGHRAVMDFLKSLCGQDVKPCYRLKMMVVGQENVGKTSVLRHLKAKTDEASDRSLRKQCSVPDVSTDGITISKMAMTLKVKEDNVPVKVNFDTWDFAGQEVYYVSHQFFLTDGAVYLVVWNINNSDEASRISYWLSSIKHKAPNSAVILVATHADGAPKQAWNMDSLFRKYNRLYPNVASAVAVGCVKGGIGFDKLWTAIESALQQQEWVGMLIPSRYFQLEELLKEEASKRSPPIVSISGFVTLCDSLSFHGKDVDYAKSVMKRFGVLFDIPEESGQEETIVLDLSWLVTMMASLLTVRHTYCKDGILQHTALRDLWRPPNFPESIHLALMNLLKRFQIAFCLNPDVRDFYQRKSLVPAMLPEDRPAGLEKAWPTFSDEEFCKRVFSMDFLPLGFFSRYMVRVLSRKPRLVPQLMWRSGILLKAKRKTIFIELLPEEQKIHVSVRGRVTSKFFTYIVDSVEAVAKWDNLNYTAELSCIHCYQQRSNEPYLFTKEECETALADGSSVVYCQGMNPVRLDKLAPDLSMASLADKKIDYSDLKLKGTPLGEGSFARVILGDYKGQAVAVKEIKNESQDFGDFRREIWAMSGLIHANIVRLVGFCTTPLCIISEYISEGTLYDYVYNKENPLPLAFLLRVAMDISKGLRFLHWRLSPPMIHNDLKSPNVLLCSRDENATVVAKITDFGMSSQAFQDARGKDAEYANPRWLAPEVLKLEDYTSKIDIYSLGVILWEMVTREAYMEDRFMYKMRDRIVAGERPSVPPETIPQLTTLITQCWADKADDRPNINSVIKVLLAIIAEHCTNLLGIAAAERPLQSTSYSTRATIQDLRSSSSGKVNALLLLHSIKSSEVLKYQPEHPISCLLNIPELGIVLGADTDGSIIKFREDGQFVIAVKCHESRILNMIQCSKETVWTCSQDNLVRIWNIDKLELIRELKVKSQPTCFVKIPGFIWIGTNSNEFHVVNKFTLALERKIELSMINGGIEDMIYRKPYIWAASRNEILRIDPKTDKIIDVLSGHTKRLAKLILVGLDEVWSCASDRNICVWDAKTGQCSRVLSAHGGKVNDVIVEKSHRNVVWSCSVDKRIYVWDVRSKRLIAEVTPSVHSESVLALIQVGGMIWSSGSDKKLCLWQTVALQDLVNCAKKTDFETFANLLKTPQTFGSLENLLPKPLGIGASR